MASKTELAKAYVEIIPSATGIGGKISEALGGEVTAAGATAGQSLGKSLIGAVGKILAAAGIGKMLQAAFTEGSAFETEVAKVGTIADTTKVPIGELKEQITDLSGTMGIAAGDLAEATYQAISAGQDTGDAVAFAGQAAKLAAAGFTSSSSAVDILTTALNAYGLGADKATHVSDVLLTTQNLGKTSVDELSASMGRVIPLAAAYKVNVENLSSGLAIMTANGIATAEATTYTKSMLNELGDTGSTVGKILQKETGQGFAELMDSGQSLGDVLQVLYDSVGGDATKFAALWSSVEAGTGALSLANSGAEKFNDVLGQIGEFILNVLSAEQFAAAVKAGEIDPNQMYLTPEKQLVVAVSEDEYEAMKAAGTLDEDVLYVTPVTEQTTIAEATETTAGLMPPSAVTKLKGIDEGANKYTHPTHTARASGLYKITVDSLGHVIAVSAVQKSDITNLGIPDSDTTYDLASDYSNGLMSADQYTKLKGIASGANKTTVDAALSSSSANPVQNKVLYVALPWEYYATFYVDSWTTASTDEQAQGFAYKQTVYPAKKISVAPTLTANSMFLSLGSTNKTNVFATDVILADSMDKINAGLVYTGAGTITALVEEKPSSDIVMNWWLRT